MILEAFCNTDDCMKQFFQSSFDLRAENIRCEEWPNEKVAGHCIMRLNMHHIALGKAENSFRPWDLCNEPNWERPA